MRDRLPILGLAAVAALTVLAAIGRQRGFEALSPPDVAFFHQSTWSAAQGQGFAQTALEFDRGALLGSVHLSPVRLLWVPLYRLLPSLSTLVALQAAVVLLGAVIVARLAGASARIAAAVFLLHPLTIGLACTDLRPLVFVVPGVLAVVLGLARGRVSAVVLGGLWTIAAREEAPFLLAALLPWALAQRSGLRCVLALTGCVAAGFAAPMLAWGHLSNISINQDPVGALSAIGDGGLPGRSGELGFGLRCLLAAPAAALAPTLLVPAAAGWALLVVLGQMEPMAPGEGGVHYLAVVHPLLLAAAAVGVTRLPERWGRLRSGAVALALLGGLPELAQSARWAAIAVAGPRGEVADLERLLEPARADRGAVLADPEVAPLLAERPILRVRGHFAATPERVSAVADEVRWMVGRPGAAREEERALWDAAFAARGFQRRGEAGEWELWGAPDL